MGAQTAGLAEDKGAGVTNMEEVVSAAMYSSQNDFVDAATMREIARVRSVIMALVEHGVRVDEDMVMKGYQVAAEAAGMGGEYGDDIEEAGDDLYLGGEKGEKLVKKLRGRA